MEFPAFEAHPDLAYLDSAATAQKPRSVLDAEFALYLEASGNVHRAIHSLGEEATRRYEGARTRMARFLGSSADEIVFTSGATASINLVAMGLADTLKRGDEVLLTVMEHHSNIVPWQILAKRKGLVVRFVPVEDSGELDSESFARLLNPRTRIVALSMASNVLGTINPVREIAAMAHANGSLVLLDAAQAAPRMRIDVAALGADFLALSGHKMYGPTGIGVLYGRRELLEMMDPPIGGGGMIRDVREDGFEAEESPRKFEAGTPPIAQAAGLAAAADWLESVGLDALGAYESGLARDFIDAVRGIRGLRVLGGARERAGIVSFSMEGIHAHDLVAYLDRRGIALRAGHHCARPLALKLGVPSSARASFGAYSLPEDAERAARAIAEAAREL
jgi:cysteine desulfurase/selenocysteine lyase